MKWYTDLREQLTRIETDVRALRSQMAALEAKRKPGRKAKSAQSTQELAARAGLQNVPNSNPYMDRAKITTELDKP